MFQTLRMWKLAGRNVYVQILYVLLLHASSRNKDNFALTSVHTIMFLHLTEVYLRQQIKVE